MLKKFNEKKNKNKENSNDTNKEDISDNSTKSLPEILIVEPSSVNMDGNESVEFGGPCGVVLKSSEVSVVENR